MIWTTCGDGPLPGRRRLVIRAMVPGSEEFVLQVPVPLFKKGEQTGILNISITLQASSPIAPAAGVNRCVQV